MAKRDVRTKPFWRFIFVVYSGLMIWLLFFRDRNLTEGLAYSEALQKNMNLKLFYTIQLPVLILILTYQFLLYFSSHIFLISSS